MLFLANSDESRERSESCACKGACTGYATRSNCPPLIVLAIAALATGAQIALLPTHA
jgi:hypothetical protein